MKVKNLRIIRKTYNYLVNAYEHKWDYQEGVNYGILCGHLAFSKGNDFKLLSKLIDLYNNDIKSFLSFDFSGFC